MRTRFWAGVLVVAATSSSVCIAKGSCPAGMYPIYSPGVMGCAPIPTLEPPPPRPVDYWGALASDASGSGINGVSADLPSRRAASKAALGSCKDGGGRDCKVVATYVNSCIVVATPTRDGQRAAGRFAYQLGPDPERLRTSTLQLCAELNGMVCEIGYQQCSVAAMEGLVGPPR